MNKFNIGDTVKVVDTANYRNLGRIGRIYRMELPTIQTEHENADNIIYGVMFVTRGWRSAENFKSVQLKKVEDLERKWTIKLK